MLVRGVMGLMCLPLTVTLTLTLTLTQTLTLTLTLTLTQTPNLGPPGNRPDHSHEPRRAAPGCPDATLTSTPKTCSNPNPHPNPNLRRSSSGAIHGARNAPKCFSRPLLPPLNHPIRVRVELRPLLPPLTPPTRAGGVSRTVPEPPSQPHPTRDWQGQA